MITQEQIMQEWIADFVDTYNREPSKETIQLWKYQIWELHFNEEHE